jgi:hypothetical protein
MIKICSWQRVQRKSSDTQAYSVGEAPYNVLTKFANLNLTYPATGYYDCDMSKAECQSSGDEILIANVTSAVA